jgi:lactaldehyde dehydrogenase/glycolaldehyde dehydrogenase
MNKYHQFINGELRDSHSKDQIEVLNPFTEKVVALAPNGDARDTAEALEAAHKAQPGWASKTVIERAGFLNKMAQAIRDNRVELAKTLTEEQAEGFGARSGGNRCHGGIFRLLRRLGKKIRRRDH